VGSINDSDDLIDLPGRHLSGSPLAREARS